MITKQNNQPEALKEVRLWPAGLMKNPINPSTKYVIRQGTSEVLGKFQEVIYKMDISTLTSNSEDKGIGLNDIFKANSGESNFVMRPLLQKPQNRIVDNCGRNE